MSNQAFKRAAFQPLLLQSNHIPLFLKLQAKVRRSLGEDEKHFLKPRTAQDLLAHLGHRMPVLGVMDRHGQLVAQALLSYPFFPEAVKNTNGYPIGNAATTAIVQSLCSVEKGQAQILLAFAKALAEMSGHAFLLAKVADANKSSAKSFMAAEFDAVAGGLDPAKGYAVTYYKHNLYQERGPQGCGAASAALALAA